MLVKFKQGPLDRQRLNISDESVDEILIIRSCGTPVLYETCEQLTEQRRKPGTAQMERVMKKTMYANEKLTNIAIILESVRKRLPSLPLS